MKLTRRQQAAIATARRILAGDLAAEPPPGASPLERVAFEAAQRGRLRGALQIITEAFPEGGGKP